MAKRYERVFLSLQIVLYLAVHIECVATDGIGELAVKDSAK